MTIFIFIFKGLSHFLKMCEPKYRPFKVWDKERIVTKGFTVSSFQELKNKGKKIKNK